MWLIKIILCLLHGHAFTDISAGKMPYRYCLRCGRVEPIEAQEIVKPF
jgi:hypothetical protein